MALSGSLSGDFILRNGDIQRYKISASLILHVPVSVERIIFMKRSMLVWDREWMSDNAGTTTL